MDSNEPITQLLTAWSGGDEAAFGELMPLVHERLRKIAARHLSRERSNHTLQPTALINEAYLSLVGSDVQWSDRLHFYAVSSNVMRRILIDHARAALRKKRGGGLLQVTLSDADATSGDSSSLLELDDALGKLGGIDPRKVQILEMHYFGGLGYEEVAAVLQLSAATVNRELRFSKAWLKRELSDEGHP
jgi:RNA polymerase sigma factor (TIGR02999 family)